MLKSMAKKKYHQNVWIQDEKLTWSAHLQQLRTQGSINVEQLKTAGQMGRDRTPSSLLQTARKRRRLKCLWWRHEERTRDFWIFPKKSETKWRKREERGLSSHHECSRVKKLKQLWEAFLFVFPGKCVGTQIYFLCYEIGGEKGFCEAPRRLVAEGGNINGWWGCGLMTRGWTRLICGLGRVAGVWYYCFAGRYLYFCIGFFVYLGPTFLI